MRVRETLAACMGLDECPGYLAGIELENEADRPLGNFTAPNWRVVKDGSLRDFGYEFVTVQPFTESELASALEDLRPRLKGYGFSFSERTSTHIHVNMLDTTFQEIKTFLFLYVLLEPTLFLSVKKGRRNNAFCVSSKLWKTLCRKSYDLRTLFRLINVEGEENLKYSSLNFYTLRKLGTLECRIFHSTFDKTEILRWVRFLFALKRAASLKSAEEWKQLFTEKDPTVFLFKVLGRELYSYFKQLAEGPEKLRKLLRDGFLDTVQVL